MKKLIVMATIFLATACWADMPEEIFEMTNTVDVTSLKKNNTTNDKFGMTKDNEEFKLGVKEYFMLKDTYFIVKDWTNVGDSTQCIAATDLKTIFAICIDDKTVIIKEVK